MRVLFTSTWGYGHVLPMVPLARALRDAGHAVLWATNEPACALVTAAGVGVVPAGLDAAGVGAVQQRLRQEAGALRGQDRAAFAYPHMFGEWATPPMVADLLPLARQWGPDLVVSEQAELGGPLVAAVLGVPAVTHSYGGAVPAIHLAGAAERLAGLWAAHGLGVTATAGTCSTIYLDLCPPSVQTQSLSHVAHRQPLRPLGYTGESTGPLPDLARADDPRPLVYLTLGTVQNSAAVLAAAAAGLADLEIRLLVSVGPDADPGAVGPQPGNVAVERWISQSEVLPRCAAVVSHGGSGTFLATLALGLPQVCLPQAADQFRNAIALTGTRTGVALPPGDATPEAVGAALRLVLVEPGFRAAAQQVAREIEGLPLPAEVVPGLAALAGRP